MSEEKGGYVYLIVTAHGTKIGHTSSLSSRLNTILNACPHDPLAVMSLWCPRPRRIEKELHDRYKHKRINREWYSISLRLANHVYYNMVNQYVAFVKDEQKKAQGEN